MKRQENRFQYTLLAGLVLLCLFLGLQKHPPILGWWEGSMVFHTFAPAQVELDMQIHPRANIAGYGYAVIDLSRKLAEFLGFTLSTIRFIPMLTGWACLLLFFLFIKRWQDWPTAAFGTALLALNPVFLIYQHQNMIAITTMACVLFCLERFGSIDEEKPTTMAAITFGIACALAAIHYAMGRYLMLVICAFWIIRRVELKTPSLHWTSLASKAKRQAGGMALFSFSISLLALDYKNLFLLLNRRFLSPDHSEHATTLAGTLSSVAFNSKFIFEAFTGLGGRLGPHSSDLIVDVPYRLISLPILVLFLAGVAGGLKRPLERKTLLSYCLLFITVTLPVFSMLTENGRGTTLSTYRMYLALIPIYSFCCLGARWTYLRLRDSSWQRNLTPLLLSTALSFIAHEGSIHLTERARFEKFLAEFQCDFSIPETPSENDRLICRHPAPAPPGYVREFEAYDAQVPYYRLARDIREKLGDSPNSSNAVTLIDAPAWRFSPISRLSHYQGHNYHQIFLALYLNNLGIDTSIIQIFTEDPNSNGAFPSRIKRWIKSQLRGLRQNVTDMGPSRLFPPKLDFLERRYAHPEGETRFSLLRHWGWGKGRYWLITTDEEKSAALKILKESDLGCFSLGTFSGSSATITCLDGKRLAPGRVGTK